ncbi:MAG TPA: histidine phosphatase family protein [Usitatibacter sp.]|nr:histidine phosphatase family protein [Usitatibacter sp.]
MRDRRAFLLGAAALVIAPRAYSDVPSPRPSPKAEGYEAWERLRKGGLVVLMRHAATEPGLGDPKGFSLADCKTQRNLSHEGRRDASRIGERFRSERVPITQVFTSPWCRCRETAMLAFGRAEDWSPLSSFFDFPHQEAEFTERVKKRIGGYARRKPAGNVIMVTHNVNIAALSKHSVATGEMVLMRPDGCCDAKPLERLKA